MIDLYCERTDPGLFAEPLNALTNLFFLLAAWQCARLALQKRRHDALLLAVILFTIGIGSGLFHTFATTWAQWLDVTPILIFQIVYLWFYVRRIARLRFMVGAALLALFFAAIVASAQFPELQNGSLSYAPAAAALILIGTYHYTTKKADPVVILAAGMIFLVSLSARTVDLLLCVQWPLGTHFIWHSLNALVLFLVLRTYIKNVSSEN